MAQSSTIVTLKDALIRYLQICENLGQHEMVLLPETILALKTMQSPSHQRQVSPTSESEHKLHEAEKSTQVVEKSSPPAASIKLQSKVSIQPKLDRELAGLSKREGLEVIRQDILSDQRLPELFQRAQNMVFGTGHLNAQIMFIGEAPGADEDRQGEPFVGAAGKLLDKMIAAMGLKRQDVYISNVVKYRPDMPVGSRGNRKPTSEELLQCRPHIMRQIAVIQPKVIVGLGATALEGLLEQPRVSITRLRGTWQQLDGIALMPTFHPAYLLHNDSVTEKRKVWEDLLQVMEKIGLPISEKQRRYFQARG